MIPILPRPELLELGSGSRIGLGTEPLAGEQAQDVECISIVRIVPGKSLSRIVGFI
jgi:hypothetical protein